jgi:hypothetical protein
MDTKKALLLLEKVNGNKDAVLEIAKSYVADMLSVYHSVEDYALMKNGVVTPFVSVDEFAKLRKNVAKIEAATDIIDEFFLINDDIAKVKEYLNSNMLVPYEEPEEEEVPQVKVSQTPKISFGKTSSSSSSTNSSTAASSESKKPVSSNYVQSEPEKKADVEERKADVKDETVGIRKVDTEEEVKALVGYAEGSNYENPYETVYEDDAVPSDQVPTAVYLFNSPPKTKDEDLIAEARMVIDEGKNYVYTGANPSAYLNKRFEYYRIKYALKNIDDGGEPEPEIEIIKSELAKIREFETRNNLISIQLVEYDMALVEKVYGLLKEFDEKLYPPEALPNIDRLRELMDSLSDYDEKASLLTKFYKFDVVNFLKTVYTSCSSLELDKNKRLSVEKERLEQEYFDQVMALEKEQYASKQKFLGKVLGGAKNSNDSKKKELQDKMNRELEELEKEITEIVASDTKMVGKNMKLYARIDNILKNNVLCFKIK